MKQEISFDLMRRIDYRLGVPICFVLAVIDSVKRLFRSVEPQREQPRKILFIKPAEIGGIILSYPLISQVQKEVPRAELYFLTFKRNSEVFEVMDVIARQNILTIRDGSVLTFLWDSLGIIIKIRRLRMDAVFDLEFFSRYTAIISYLGGIPKRIGFYQYTMEGLYRGNLLTHKIAYNPHVHMAEIYWAMGQALKEKGKDSQELGRTCDFNLLPVPRYVPSPEQEKEMRKRLLGSGVPPDGKIYLINPGEGRLPLREWPLASFNQLTNRILEDDNSYIIIVGLASAFQQTKELQIMRGRAFDWRGKTTVQELLTLCSVSQALIANDSGLAHLASLTDIKQFILFGPESPRIFSPLGKNIKIFYSSLPCSPCLSVFNHRTSRCRDNICMQRITPESVYDAVAGEMPAFK